LLALFEQGAENASEALTKWLRRPIRLSINSVEELDLADALATLGPEETPVVACSMDLEGPLRGELLLVFEDGPGLALCDMVVGAEVGTARDWGELEVSAALETINIVGCAFLNAIGSRLDGETLTPSPPTFRREFAGSLLEFALMDQAAQGDRVFQVRCRFAADTHELAWWLLFIPAASAMQALRRALGEAGGP
jgi:chemotaxis protein CheC